MTYDLNWELRLGFLIHDVSRMRRSVVDRVLKPLGVTRSQWWVLAFLSREDGMPQVALADQLDLGKVALGGLIDRLEASGMVARAPDKVDRRVKRIFVTKLGRDLIERIRESVSEAENEILQKIPTPDLQATVRALRLMKTKLLEMLDSRDSTTQSAPEEGEAVAPPPSITHGTT
ncbi:MAG: MarR family transcriptional regulator [Bradyrhizobium sp.]|nr:MarR family transcriptional regulator [Bradyrhizobium sp.]